MMPSRAQASTLVVLAIAALRVGVRDRTFWWLALLFLALVLVSAYLGWSATATANAVYLKSAAMLQEQGKAVPPNPVVESSPLALLRNMATYVALLGALAGIVLGHQMVAADRKAGVVPLLASRPVGRMTLAISKILALVIAIAGLLALSCAVNAVTMLVISGASLSGEIWLRLGAFCAVSALFVLAFALLGAVCAAVCRSESTALLLPVTIWLMLTFIVPQLTANINPMAALNPLSAIAPPPPGAFFAVTGAVLGPVSIAEAYRVLAASLLGFAPAGLGPPAVTGAGTTLKLTIVVMIVAVLIAVHRLDACRSDYSD
jgi:ABC-type transport system involved in multi-copper enzyme maturation permease subunit